MSEATHTITVEVDAKHPMIGTHSHMVSVQGCGDIEHWERAFKAALLAAGFDAETAAGLRILKRGED